MGPGAPVENLLEKIRAAVGAQVDWIQIREKDQTTRELLALAQEAVGITQTRGGKTRVLVNDRLDVALACGAAGVHLGRESVPAKEVVKWCRAGNAPDRFLIGVSCHSVEETQAAESAGADYVFFGPIYDTPSKRAFGNPQGIARLVEVSAAVRIPVIAIGGINEQNAAECLRAGAKGIAAIRLFQEAKDGPALVESVAGLRGGI